MVITNLAKKKTPIPGYFTEELYQIFSLEEMQNSIQTLKK